MGASWARPADPYWRLSAAEVLTTALVTARYFGGNLVLDRHYMEQHWGMKSLDKSGFACYLHRWANTLLGLFATFGQVLRTLHTDARYIIDSSLVAVCQNTCIGRN